MTNPVAISGHTRVLGILGDPIRQVKTPAKMNAHLSERGIDALMVPFHVTAHDLTEVMDALRKVRSIAGFVVTVPHKIAIMECCDDLDETARIAGAVNVIRRADDGALEGANYDGYGFVRSIRDKIGSVEGRSVYLYGAGGVARAIAASFASAGIDRLVICNRTEARAIELAEAIRQRFPGVMTSVGGPYPAAVDIAVNASSVGLRDEDPAPFSLADLSQDCLVADVIMQPLITRILAEAKGKGHPICTGDGMLEHQLAAFTRFLDLDSEDGTGVTNVRLAGESAG